MSDLIYLSEYDSLIREILSSGGEFRLYPRGTSMLPLLRQGRDSVSLRSLERSPQKFDILFYQRLDGSYVLHRVKEVSSAGLILWGDNQYRLEYGVKNNQIIGYAARIFRDDHELDCHSLSYRIYLRLWQFKTIRRFLLPIVYRVRRIHVRKEITGHAEN